MTVVKKWFGTWITPQQGLPVPGTQILIEYKTVANGVPYDSIITGFYMGETKVQEWTGKSFMLDRGYAIKVDDVTAWMYLPEMVIPDSRKVES